MSFDDTSSQLAGVEVEADAGDFSEFDPAADENRPERLYCAFRAGRERFCLSVLEIEEVVDWPKVTRIPLGPPHLLGVFNLRGTIVPLIDIAFTEGRHPGMLPKHVVVTLLKGATQQNDVRIGVAADEVMGTFSAIDEALLDQTSNVPYCSGMLRHDDRLALVVDLQKLTEIFPAPVI